jgi:hypothetical protein
MLLTPFFIIASGVLALVSSLFPVIPISSGISSAVSASISALWSLNSFIPVPTLALVVGLLVSIEIGILVFKFFRWFMSHIPFVGGKGV